ncbi:MAG: hypothetical protein PVF68_02325 [Acidobacteriota bacterium]|jgi:hypothetical protein
MSGCFVAAARSRIPFLGLIAVLACAACHSLPAPPAGPVAAPLPAGNRFPNPSFEEGRKPWFSLENPFWAGFVVTATQARSGRHSALLRLRSGNTGLPTTVQGLVADVDGGPLPRRLSGWYRVDDWRRGAPSQFVQIVVSVAGASNLDPDTPQQIAYVLTGVLDPVPDFPFRPFLFLGEAEPRRDTWIPFDIDLAADYREHYGVIPEGYGRLRVFFEVRFERREPASADPVVADVYFDDLYLGDATE